MFRTYEFTSSGTGLFCFDVYSEGELKGKFHTAHNNDIYCRTVTEGTIPCQKSKQKLTTYKLKSWGAGLFGGEVV